MLRSSLAPVNVCNGWKADIPLEHELRHKSKCLDRVVTCNDSSFALAKQNHVVSIPISAWTLGRACVKGHQSVWSRVFGAVEQPLPLPDMKLVVVA